MPCSANQLDDPGLLTLLEDALDFVVYRVAVDPHSPYGGRVLMVSPSIKDIAGIRDPWRFETWFDGLHPDDREAVLAANRRAWEQRRRYDQYARFFHPGKGEWVWLHTISTPAYDSEGRLQYFTGIIVDVSEQKRAEAELRHRIQLENLILALSTRFINLEAGQVDEAIQAALQQIGEFTGVERSYVYAFSADRQRMTCTHEWCAPGVQPLIHLVKNVSTTRFDWSIGKLLRGEILHIPDVAALPDEARAEREQFSAQGARSVLSVPMVYQGEVTGSLGFDALHTSKTWPDENASLLQMVGAIFVNALENQRAQMALMAAQSELEQRVIERTSELRQANAALLGEIEQRRQAEEKLVLSQALQTEVFENSPLQIFVIETLADGRFRVLKTNPAHQHNSGVPAEQINGKIVDEVLPPEVAAAVNQHYRECVDSGRPIEYQEVGPSPYWDMQHLHTFRTTLAPVRNGQGRIVRLVGASADITEQKRAEQIIMDQARQEAVATERNRLARELHDAVTQTLFSTTLIADVLPAIWERSPAEGREQLQELRELTRGALAEMRTLLMELRPAALETTELNDLLRQLAAAFTGRARVPVALQIEPCPRLPLEVKVALYRIAQEGLNNIAKHADASQVSLSLRCGKEIELEIRDDGRGFELDDLPAGRFGLGIMRERAGQVGARIEINSQVGAGSCVRVQWAGPLTGEGQT